MAVEGFQNVTLSPEQVARLRGANGALDSESGEKFRRAVEQKHPQWELDHIRLDEGVAVLRRVRSLTEVSTGVDGVVTVSPADKRITDGRKFAAWVRTHHKDMEVLTFDPVAVQGHIAKMDADVARCREATAKVVGCDPWDVPIRVVRSKGSQEPISYEMILPIYVPSKHLEGLTEVATEIVGDYRWTVEVDSMTKACSLRMIPDTLDRDIPWVPESDPLKHGVRIGLQADGEPWRLPVLGTHTLVVAETGWGKGSILWGIVRGLAPAIREGRVVIWAVDLKGGVEVSMGRGFFGRVATTHPEAVRMLRDARAIMDARLANMAATRSRTHVPTAHDPLLLVLFDEFTALRLAAPDSKSKAAAEVQLTLLLTQGRAPGVCLGAFLQSPKDKDVPARDFFPRRVLGKIANRGMVNKVLGDLAKERGADATALPQRLRGTFYVAADGGAPPVRCRAHYSTDDVIRSEGDAIEPYSRKTQDVVDQILARVLDANGEEAQMCDTCTAAVRSWIEQGKDPAELVGMAPPAIPKLASAEFPGFGPGPEDAGDCESCGKPINPLTGECACTT